MTTNLNRATTLKQETKLAEHAMYVAPRRAIATADSIEGIASDKSLGGRGEGTRGEIRAGVGADVGDAALGGAFVFIDEIEKGRAWCKPATDGGVISQKGRGFISWGQGARRGPVIIGNSAPGARHDGNTRELSGSRVVRRRSACVGSFAFPCKSSQQTGGFGS